MQRSNRLSLDSRTETVISSVTQQSILLRGHMVLGQGGGIVQPQVSIGGCREQVRVEEPLRVMGDLDDVHPRENETQEATADPSKNLEGEIETRDRDRDCESSSAKEEGESEMSHELPLQESTHTARLLRVGPTGISAAGHEQFITVGGLVVVHDKEFVVLDRRSLGVILEFVTGAAAALLLFQ